MAEDPQTQTSTSSQQSSLPISSEDPPKLPQVQGPAFYGLGALPNGDVQMFPIMYPALVPGLFNSQNQEQMNRGAGIYAVPVLPFTNPVAGFPPNTLIPLTYSSPTRTSSPEAATGVEQGQQQQQQQQPQQQQQQHPAPQRPVVVRRFQIAIQLDLFLILKLAAVIFLFNQDGSKQRLVLLVLLASLVYLYQTGALTPLVRWLSQGMQRAAAPPQPPRPAAARADNVPPGARQGNENAAAAAGADGQPEAENENQPLIDRNQAVENNEQQVLEPGANPGGNRWWGIIKEVQMIVFGFITSLLPGFHNIE